MTTVREHMIVDMQLDGYRALAAGNLHGFCDGILDGRSAGNAETIKNAAPRCGRRHNGRTNPRLTRRAS